jgi:hypothetical protein
VHGLFLLESIFSDELFEELGFASRAFAASISVGSGRLSCSVRGVALEMVEGDYCYFNVFVVVRIIVQIVNVIGERFDGIIEG